MKDLADRMLNAVLSHDDVEKMLTQYAQQQCKRPAPTGDDDEEWWAAKTQAMDLLLLEMVRLNNPQFAH